MSFRFVIFIFLFIIFAGCSQRDEIVVARVFDKTLTVDDLQGYFPDFEPNSDSVVIPAHYIEAWIQQQALVHMAEQTLTKQEQDFDKQLENYYQTLLIFAYENKEVAKRLDRNVKEKEITDYYEKHKSEFEIRKNIVKVNYAKFAVDFPQINTVKNLLFLNQRTKAEQDRLYKICSEHAENMYMESDWLLFDDILKEIPINAYNQEQFLKKNRHIEIADTNNVYLIHILDFKINETYSPLSLEWDKIKNIIISQRRQELIQQIRKDALNHVKDAHEIEINFATK